MGTSITILGSNGQLGREFRSLLSGDDGVHALTRTDADLAIPGQITMLLQKLKPRLVINCSAYNLVDVCETAPEVAFAVNAFGVRELAIACRDVHATLVQFSTDYVFGLDEKRQTPYGESDSPGPVSSYGLSKLSGEYFVRSLCPSHFVIRTCGLYGRHGAGGKGTNFVETMLKLAAAGKTIRVVNDQILTPTSAADVAEATRQLVRVHRPGIYHLTNSGECSWYEFARTIFELAGVQADLQPTTSAEYGSKARRPAYSVLSSEHSCTPTLRSWRDALQAYLAAR
ncbi:MAG TPA: dTDP-4-dehydrorhamnose reductase [Gemmatales bacterium]|nr:dTDP-4-dehydrorhamnose reductase [Gemmatales bacterium]